MEEERDGRVEGERLSQCLPTFFEVRGSLKEVCYPFAFPFLWHFCVFPFREQLYDGLGCGWAQNVLRGTGRNVPRETWCVRRGLGVVSQ